MDKDIVRIAFGGRKYSGKDTFTDILEAEYNFTPFSFSDQLKKVARQFFPFMQLDYPSEDKETKIVHTNLDTGQEFTPRDIWQALDILPEIYPMVFVEMLKQEFITFVETCRAHQINKAMRVVIKDVRRPTELRYTKGQGYYLIYVDTDDERSFNNKAQHKSESFQEEIKAKADSVYFNSKKNPNWEKDLREFLVKELEKLGVKKLRGEEG